MLYDSGRDAGNSLMQGVKDTAGSSSIGGSVVNAGTFGEYDAAKDLFPGRALGGDGNGLTWVGETAPSCSTCHPVRLLTMPPAAGT